MVKLKRDWRGFALALSVCATIAALLAWWLSVSFWLLFPVIVGSLYLNGRIAEWEDNRPGGFHNPYPPSPDDPPRQH